MDEKNTRRIDTPFYGDIAYEILQSVHGQLSDGKWENSPGYDKYWTNFHVNRDTDNKIYFSVSTKYWNSWCNKNMINPFIEMDADKFLDWYANKLKAVIKDEGRDESWPKGWWNRTNTTNESIYLNYHLNVTVADVYAVYDWLKGRIDRSSQETHDRVYGQPIDSETIAKRIAYESLCKKAKSIYEAELKNLTDKFESDKKIAWENYQKTLKEIAAAS